MKYLALLLTILAGVIVIPIKRAKELVVPVNVVAPHVLLSFDGPEFRARVTGSDATVYSPEAARALDGQLIQVVKVPREAAVCIELDQWVACAMRKPLLEGKGI